MRPLVLASASPRRRQLLAEAGLEIVCVPADIDEQALPAEPPWAHVERLAREKAEAVAGRFPQQVVLGADTIVYLDGEILGKPRDLDDARRMLAKLGGRTHQVYSGVCLLRLEPRRREHWHAVTQVTFKPLDQEAVASYLRLAQPLDKAGAYGIQEYGEIIVAGCSGLFSNVVGLPVEEVLPRLRGFGA